MAYITNSDIQAWLGTAAYVALTDDAGTGSADTAKVDQARLGAEGEVNSYLAGMIALALVFSSYASEVFLSAFRGITLGQYEGAYALGLSRFRTMLLVILPQLIRLALPGGALFRRRP